MIIGSLTCKLRIQTAKCNSKLVMSCNIRHCRLSRHLALKKMLFHMMLSVTHSCKPPQPTSSTSQLDSMLLKVQVADLRCLNNNNKISSLKTNRARRTRRRLTKTRNPISQVSESAAKAHQESLRVLDKIQRSQLMLARQEILLH